MGIFCLYVTAFCDAAETNGNKVNIIINILMAENFNL